MRKLKFLVVSQKLRLNTDIEPVSNIECSEKIVETVNPHFFCVQNYDAQDVSEDPQNTNHCQ